MKAPESIPYKMFDSFAMGGKAIVEYRYCNDCSQETQQLINNNYTKDIFEESLENNVNGVDGSPYQPVYILKNT